MRNWDRKGRSASTGEMGVEDAVPGVIDTLGIGYASLIARPLIMAPLLLIDLLILFSPSVPLAPLSDAVTRDTDGQGAAWGDLRHIPEWVAGYNVVELTALQGPLLRTPAIVPSLSGERMSSFSWHMSLSSLPVALVAGAVLLALAVGLITSVVFRLLLASGGLGIGSYWDATDPRLVGWMSLRLVGWVSAIVGLLVLITMPILVVTGIGLIFGFGGSRLLWLLALIPIAWGFVHFFFSVHALFVDRIGPFDALRSSYLVVHQNFWQSVQFIGTTMLIMTGVTYALRQMATNAGGVLAASIINTFVATGIVVAAMLFYRDRARRQGLPDSASGR